MAENLRLPIRARHRQVLGIDYGTTHSGLCFAESTETDFLGIAPWMQFPGRPDEYLPKAPSCIAFASENDEPEDLWGYQVKPWMKSYHWTKLLLDKAALPSEYDDPDLRKAIGSNVMQLPPGKTAKDVATEYFRGLKKMYDRALVDKGSEDFLASLPMDVWLTVPATWSEYAKHLTKAAALDAGFASRPEDRLKLISEPEAAAHLALQAGFNEVHDYITQGSGVMICDMGGGTVVSSRFTTYEVKKTKPLRLREVCAGVGGKCGGTFLDRNFRKLMNARFGSAFSSLDLRLTGPGSEFMIQFERVKRDFGTKSTTARPDRLTLHMEGLEMTPELEKHYHQTFHHVLISQDDMRKVFEPVSEKVVGLVSEQLKQAELKNSKVDALVLIGGMAASPYLKQQLQDWSKKHSIRCIHPWKGPWSAVVCGAVLTGLQEPITAERICRRHYGFEIGKAYDPKIHKFDKSKRELWHDTIDNIERLSGFMVWSIAKGAKLTASTSITSTFGLHTSRDSKFTHTLYACSSDEAPATIEDDRVEKVGQISYTLDEDVFANLRRKYISHNRDGRTTYSVSLDVNVRLNDESGLLTFRILHKGKECGKANFDFYYT